MFYKFFLFQYILCCGSTAERVAIREVTFKFQYILCCGSTMHVFQFQKGGCYFNTSYVAVQQKAPCLIYSKLLFQYILCCGSTVLNIGFIVPQLSISIHLMLRFNKNRIGNLYISQIISIHLMLRFNNKTNTHLNNPKQFQYILCCGSTPWKNVDGKEIVIFQYILCCGSTFVKLLEEIKQIKFQYILCCGSTFLVYCQGVFLKKFQYILCCGSTLCGYTFYFFHHIKKALKLQYFPLFFPMISAVWAKIKK